jgi:tape measure domain-containing protein
MSTEVGSLQANLTLDMRDFRAGMSEAAALAAQLAAQLQATFSNTGNLNAVLLKVRELQESINLLRGSLSDLQASMSALSGADIFAQMRAHTAGLAADVAKLQSGLSSLKAPTGASGMDFSAPLAQLQQIQTLLAQVSASSAQFRGVDADTGELLEDTSNFYVMVTSVQQLNTELTTTASKMQQITNETVAWLRTLDQVMSKFNAIHASVTQTQAAMRSTGAATKGAASSAAGFTQQTEKAAKNLQTTKGYAVSLKGIIGGIVVSQAFYSMLNIMEELVNGAVQFSQNMQDAAVAFEYLMADAEVSSGAFLNALKEIALVSPLDITDLTSASRKLMAMGFSAESTIPALQILTDTAAVFSNSAGDMSDMIDHIALAFGQMIAAGKVSAQELRQLYNAGLPIYQLLSDGLGISMEMAKNIGHYNVDSATAVYAVLLELQKKYGGAAQALAKTTSGSMEVIRESFQQLLSYAWADQFEVLTEKLNVLAKRMQSLVKITQAYNIGGLFQAIFPEDMWADLRLILAGVSQLGNALKTLAQILGIVFAETARLATSVGATVVPVLGTVAAVVTNIAKAALTAFPWLNKLVAAIALLTIARLVAKGVTLLAKAIYLLTGAKAAVATIKGLLASFVALLAVHPVVVAGLLAVAAAFTAIMIASENARRAVAAFFGGIGSSFASFGKDLGVGFDPGDIAMPDFELPETGDFSDGLNDLTQGMEDLGDAAEDTGEKTKKAQNNLQSFDEVYTIKEDDDTAGDMEDSLVDIEGILKQLGDLDYSNLFDWTGDWAKDWDAVKASFGDIGFGSMDLSGWATDFWNNFVTALSENSAVAMMGLGGIIGLIIGGLLGHPLIGAALGMLAGYIWDGLAEQLGISDVGKVALPVATALGGIIGGLIGGPGGAAIGAGIGLLVGSLITTVSTALETGDWTPVAYPVAIGLGAGIGYVIGGPGGAIVGAAIGLLVATLIEIVVDAIEESDWSTVGAVFGGGIGAGIGFIIGGPAGALIGAAIGTVAGWLIGNLVEAIQNDDWSTVGATVGGGIGAAIGFCVGGPVGALIGAAIGTVGGWIVGKFAELDWDGIIDAAENLIDGFIQGLEEKVSAVWDWIKDFGSSFIDGIKDVFGIHSPSREMEPMGEYIVLGLEGGLSSEMAYIETFLHENVYLPISGWFATTFTSKQFTTYGSSMILELQEGAQTEMSSFPQWLTDRVQRPTHSWFASAFAKSNFVIYGENIIKGMMQGIEDMKPQLMALVDEICAEIRERIQSALEMHSPSRFTMWAGEMLMRGMQVGIAQNAQHVFDTMADVTDTLKDSAVNMNTRVSPIADADQIVRNASTTTGAQGIMRVLADMTESTIEGLSSRIATRLYEYLAPLFATLSPEDQQQVVAYVGTLIADDRGLKQLERKLSVIRASNEERRR